MSTRHRSITAGLLAALAAQPSLAAQPASAAAAPPVAAAGTPETTAESLLRQGRYWQTHNNPARAREAWTRLLQIDPDQPEALFNLGSLAAAANQAAQAQQYLAKLRTLPGGDLYAAQLDQEIALHAGAKPQLLAQARALAESGELDKAVPLYREVFGDRQPEGKLGLEFYNYLGYTQTGWDEAHRGLQRLHQADPGNAQVTLTLAKLETRNEATRADGIRTLAALSTRSDVGGDAAENWRMALSWYGTPTPAQAPLFQAYLKAHPDDTEVRDQFARMRTQRANAGGGSGANAGTAAPVVRTGPSPQNVKLSNAFKAVEAGDLATAEAGFNELLAADPNQSDALGGLGIVRLKQDRPDEAVDLLTRATRQKGARNGWKQALASAQYWSLYSHAEQSRASGDLAGAQQQLEQAMKLANGDTNAEIALARVLAQQGRTSQAEQIFRGVLARDKTNLAAQQGLIGILAQTDRADEALRMIDALPPDQRQTIGMAGQLRAGQARTAARRASASGDDAGAIRLLENGLRSYPDDPWLRLDLARLYLKTGATSDAKGVVDGLLLSNPDDPDALYTSALLSAQLQDWKSTLATLDRIPAAYRTQDIQDLQRRAWTQDQVSNVIQLARAGRTAEAKAMLARLDPGVTQNASVLGPLTSAFIDAGDSGTALSIMRQALGRGRSDTDLLLQYTVVLLRTDQDAEAAIILRQLQGQNMTTAQTASFEDLRKLYTVRQADALRARGKVAEAYDVLAPTLAKYPDDPLVVGALARMYASAGDGAKAMSLQKPLLDKDPDNTDLLLSTAQIAVQAKDKDAAQGYIDKALAISPNDPKVLGGVGRIYSSMGRSGKAVEYLKAAIAAQNQARAQAASSLAMANMQQQQQPAAAAAAPAMAANPFRRAAAPDTYDSGPVFGQATTPEAYAAAARNAKNAPPPAPAAPPPPVILARPSASVEPARTASAVRADMDAAAAANAAPPPPADAISAAAPAAPVIAPAAPVIAPAAPAIAPSSPIISASPAVTTVEAGEIAPSALPIPPAVIGNQRTASGAPVSPFRNTDGTPIKPGQPLADATPAQPSGPKTLEQELDAVQQVRSPTITAGTTVRQHNGESGLGRMVDVEAPITARFPVGDDKAYVQVTPATVSSGSLSSAFAINSQFGGGPAAALAQQNGVVGGAGSQSATGVGLAAGYEMNGLRLDLGTTPIGFRYQNLVGGVRYDGQVDTGTRGGPQLSYGAELARRAVTDSLISYAGAHDDRTGESWGGVTSTGGRVSFGLHYGDYGFYGNLGAYSLNGHNVQSNSEIAGGAGVYVNLIRETDRTLSTGINITDFSYDKNLGGYTYGQGGYFSPQNFFAVSVPVSWAQRQGRLSYQIRGSIGVQHISQDGSDYYSDATRQANAAAIAAANGTQANYAGQSKTGIGYGLAVAAEYQLAPSWFVGGNFSVDNARDYRQLIGGLYLRYALQPQTGPVPMPVPAFASPYAAQ